MSGRLEKYHICYISSTWERVVMKQRRSFKEVLCVRTHVDLDVVFTTQDVLFKDTYIFLLLYVRATRKVSYMRYK